MPTKTVTGVVIAIVLVVALAITFALLSAHNPKPAVEKNVMQKIEVGERIKLPAPDYRSNTSVEEALSKRRSVRFYSGEDLSIEVVSQLLWAAQGITGTGRTAPSAGALYPLELYLVVGDVDGLDKGVYQYRPVEHELEKAVTGDLRVELSKAAVGQNQEHVRDAAVDLVFTAVYERTTGKYGERGFRYVHMEAGHAAQNVYLQAVSLKLGTVVIGAFIDDKVKELVNAEEQEEPLYIMPVGRTL
ncbi:Nitroreductase [Candidatus Methanophagaceae archaeon]|nr:Nitroreductase [Methanophagales archaeon]